MKNSSPFKILNPLHHDNPPWMKQNGYPHNKRQQEAYHTGKMKKGLSVKPESP